MKIWSDTFGEGGLIPPQCAFAVMDAVSHIKLSSNRNPHLAWDEVPAGTQSLVLLCHDPDVPSVGTDVNQEGRSVPASLPRVDFYYWALVDIPVSLKSIAEGKFSDMVTPHGKRGPLVPFTIKDGTEHQLRQGVNDYTGWFAGDPDMAGEYFGYDGPCPPWNDENLHHYHFRVFALSVKSLGLAKEFDATTAMEAMKGKVLAEGKLDTIFTINPAKGAKVEK